MMKAAEVIQLKCEIGQLRRDAEEFRLQSREMLNRAEACDLKIERLKRQLIREGHLV